MSKFDLNKDKKIDFCFLFFEKLKIEEQIRFYGQFR